MAKSVDIDGDYTENGLARIEIPTTGIGVFWSAGSTEQHA